MLAFFPKETFSTAILNLKTQYETNLRNAIGRKTNKQTKNHNQNPQTFKIFV